MKKVEAIIPPSRVAEVQHTLERRGIEWFTLLEVWAASAEPGYRAFYRGATYPVALLPRAKLEMVCRDEYALPVAYAIADAARTGHADDGDVLILSIEDRTSCERSVGRDVVLRSSRG